MPEISDQSKLLAFALFEMRVLLSSYLGSDNDKAEQPVRAAAHLAYALHNQALELMSGRNFDMTAALQSMAKADEMLGENFMQQYREFTAAQQTA